MYFALSRSGEVIGSTPFYSPLGWIAFLLDVGEDAFSLVIGAVTTSRQ